MLIYACDKSLSQTFCFIIQYTPFFNIKIIILIIKNLYWIIRNHQKRYIYGIKPYKVVFVGWSRFKYRMDRKISNDISIILLLSIQTSLITVASKKLWDILTILYRNGTWSISKDLARICLGFHYDGFRSKLMKNHIEMEKFCRMIATKIFVRFLTLVSFIIDIHGNLLIASSC